MTADPLSNLPPRPDWPDYPKGKELHPVVYEFDMLDFTADWLQRLGRDPPAARHQETTNAVLESFALHVRNIIAFLQLAGQERKTDLKARDYVEDVQKWTASRDSIAYGYVAAHNKASKLAAHLTKDRLEPRGKGWSLDVMPPLRELEILFYANLKPELRRGTPRRRATLFKTMSMPPLASISSDGSVSVSVNVSSGPLRGSGQRKKGEP